MFVINLVVTRMAGFMVLFRAIYPADMVSTEITNESSKH